MRGVVAVGLLALAGCSSPDSGQFWTTARVLPGNFKTVFIRIHDGGKTKRKVYEEAAAAVCHDGELCKVLFFADDDPLPRAATLAEFLSDGGFNPKTTLATWGWYPAINGARFGHWDCARAGAAEAPPDALCEQPVKTGTPHLPAAK